MHKLLHIAWVAMWNFYAISMKFYFKLLTKTKTLAFNPE